VFQGSKLHSLLNGRKKYSLFFYEINYKEMAESYGFHAVYAEKPGGRRQAVSNQSCCEE